MAFFKWLWKGLKITGISFVNFFKGVVRELKRVRWPGKKKMADNTATVVIFCAFFALFFSACYVIGEAVLSALGYFG